jgi:hypothetical protein
MCNSTALNNTKLSHCNNPNDWPVMPKASPIAKAGHAIENPCNTPANNEAPKVHMLIF